MARERADMRNILTHAQWRGCSQPLSAPPPASQRVGASCGCKSRGEKKFVVLQSFFCDSRSRLAAHQRNLKAAQKNRQKIVVLEIKRHLTFFFKWASSFHNFFFPKFRVFSFDLLESQIVLFLLLFRLLPMFCFFTWRFSHFKWTSCVFTVFPNNTVATGLATWCTNI